MRDKKMLGGVLAALGVGLGAGALLLGPSVISAQTADTTTTTAPGTTEDDNSPGRRGPRIAGVKGAGLDAAAEALGIPEDDLHDQLRDGKSIAQVAAERNVNLQTVIDAMVREATARIDDAVADGDLDADRAAELKEGLAERVTEAVNREGRDCGPGGLGRGPGGPGIIGGAFDAAADALGISEDDLHDQLHDGKSIADVAAERNVNLQTVIDAMVREATARIDDAVADGDLDADRAAELKEGLIERVTEAVNRGGGLRPRGRGPGR